MKPSTRKILLAISIFVIAYFTIVAANLFLPYRQVVFDVVDYRLALRLLPTFLLSLFFAAFTAKRCAPESFLSTTSIGAALAISLLVTEPLTPQNIPLSYINFALLYSSAIVTFCVFFLVGLFYQKLRTGNFTGQFRATGLLLSLFTTAAVGLSMTTRFYGPDKHQITVTPHTPDTPAITRESNKVDYKTKFKQALVDGNNKNAINLLRDPRSLRVIKENNTTLVSTAIKHNRVEVLEAMLTGGVVANYRDPKQGFSPLQIAADRQQTVPEILELLIKFGADINDVDRSGRSVLMLAVGKENIPAIKLLILHGADVSSEDRFGRTVYHYARSGSKAYQALLEGQRKLFEQQPMAAIDKPNKKGYSRLIRAVRSGNLQYTRSLLGQGANVDRTDFTGRTPLMHAVIRNNPAMVALLLNYGANPTLKDFKGVRAVDYAERKQNPLIIEPLALHGSQLTAATKATLGAHQVTKLTTAVNDGRIYIAHLLLQQGIEPTAEHLSKAILKGNSELVKLLLQYNVPTGKTLLRTLASRQYFAHIGPAKRQVIAKAFFNAMSDETNAHFNRGFSQVFLAILGDLQTLRQIIEQNGIEPTKQNQVYQSHALAAAITLRRYAIVDFLLDEGVNGQGTCPSSPLMLASRYELNDTVQRLLENGADYSSSNCSPKGGSNDNVLADVINSGNLRLVDAYVQSNPQEAQSAYSKLLIVATRRSDHKTALDCLAKGADINEIYDNSTALLEAIKNNDIKFVKILLKESADPNLHPPNGLSPIAQAQVSQLKEVAHILTKHGARL